MVFWYDFGDLSHCCFYLTHLSSENVFLVFEVPLYTCFGIHF